MTLIEDLIAASAGSEDIPVGEIVTGPDWIMVTAGGAGVAAGREAPAISMNGLVGEFRNRPLKDVLALASSPDRLRASLGIAALNSALSTGQSATKPRSFSIPRAGGKTVAVIGEFAFIEDLRRIADAVITIDAGSEIDPGGKPPDQALAGVDIAIIRGSTLVDGTLESWLVRTSHCYTVVYGPSTPLSSVLFDYGADQLVGISVTITDVAADWIREGRGDLLACPGIRPVVIGRDQG